MLFKQAWFRWFWLCCIAFCVFTAITRLRIETSILDLLPKYKSEQTNALMDKATEKVNKQMLLMASSKDKDLLIKHFTKALQDIDNKELYQNIVYKVEPSEVASTYSALKPYQANFLSLQDRQLLQHEQTSAHLIAKAQESLYGVQLLSAEQIQQDPLFTFQRLLSSLNDMNVMSFKATESHFMVASDQLHHMVAFVELQASAFSPQYQQQVNQSIQQMTTKLAAHDIDLIGVGAVRYAHQAYQDAKQEISTVGLGSLLAIIMLVVTVFRSLLPLALSLISISIGLVVALGISLWLFGAMHVFALVFGATIAGVSIDYCFHYLVEANFKSEGEPAFKVDSIVPALSIGFGSSALVYLGFLLTGYAVLAQIAVFSVLGLLAVLINVLCLFPWLYRPQSRPAPVVLQRLSQAIFTNPLQSVFQRPWLLLVLLASLLIAVVYTVQPNDDVRALQQLSPELKAEEAHIRQILQWQQNTHYVLLQAESMNQLLAAEATTLTAIRNDGIEVMGVSDIIPPIAVQQSNHRALQTVINSPEGQAYLADLGLDFPTHSTFKPLDPNQLMHEPLLTLMSQRLLGAVNGMPALVIPLSQSFTLPPDSPAILIQQAADTSVLFAEFRVTSTWMLAGAVMCLVLGLAWFKYSTLQALHLVSIPLLGGLVALLMAGLFGMHVSLFSVLAMLLILGMGLDYVVFLTESVHPQKVMMAMLMAGTTTVLAFGLLALSQVAVLQSFGFMVGVGMVWVLLTAPAVRVWHTRRYNESSI